ncbi:hypothetical protein QQ054_32230 [Oscillatoria amoena NRMC-F 0135]|nr:hypothetical protein [Oscillatoria amoena NRMC-F 0135]
MEVGWVAPNYRHLWQRKKTAIGFYRNEEPEEQNQFVELPKPLLQAINCISEIYIPVSRIEECDGLLLSTNDLFKQIQDFYPSDTYDAGLVAEILCNEDWQAFYHPDIKQYFWRVKKVGN